MARQKLQQSEVAKRSGISPSQISKLLRGAKPINLDQLEDLCRALRLDPYAVIREAYEVVESEQRGGRPVSSLAQQRAARGANRPALDDRHDLAVASDPGHPPGDEPEHFGA